MPEDNDEFEDFDWEPDDYDDEEAQRELDQENQRIHNLPLMKKAEEIFQLTQALVETIDEEKDVLHIREQMLSNAMILMPKIAGAEGGDLYTLRMENAVIVKIHARELLAQTSLCKMESLAEPRDLQMLRDEIELFRILFVDWVKSFDRSNDIPDNWGLFNE